MKCKLWKYHLADYATDSLDELQAHELEAHLVGCADCRKEAAQFQSLFAGMKKEASSAPSQVELNNFLVHVHEKIDQKRTDPFMGMMFLRFALPAVVCVLLLVGGVFAWKQLQRAATDLALREDLRNVADERRANRYDLPFITSRSVHA